MRSGAVHSEQVLEDPQTGKTYDPSEYTSVAQLASDVAQDRAHAGALADLAGDPGHLDGEMP